MHYYQFNIGDYRRDTIHLTLLEHGIYRQLIDSYYLNEKPLCADDAILMRSHSVRTEEEQIAFKNVLNDFFVKHEDGYFHKGCEKMLEKYKEKSEKAAKSANARWNKDANGMRTHSERNANGMLTNNQKPITNNQLEENTYVQEDAKNSTNKIVNCEYQKVIDVYHECLPELSKARLLTKARERLIKQRWNWILTSKKPDGERRATNAQEALVWFENYFNRVRDNDFLMGRVKQSNDHKNWKCDIDFLMEDRGLKHVIEKTEG